MRKAAKAISVGEGVVKYAKKNGRDFFKDKNSKVFLYKVLLNLLHIKCLTVISKRDTTLQALE